MVSPIYSVQPPVRVYHCGGGLSTTKSVSRKAGGAITGFLIMKRLTSGGLVQCRGRPALLAIIVPAL